MPMLLTEITPFALDDVVKSLPSISQVVVIRRDEFAAIAKGWQADVRRVQDLTNEIAALKGASLA